MPTPPPNARDAALARGWTPSTWLAAGHSIDPYIDSSAGGHWTANPYVSLTPPVSIVSASSQVQQVTQGELVETSLLMHLRLTGA